MSDDYDILIELSADDVAKAADEREKREAEILRLRAENEKLRAALLVIENYARGSLNDSRRIEGDG